MNRSELLWRHPDMQQSHASFGASGSPSSASPFPTSFQSNLNPFPSDFSTAGPLSTFISSSDSALPTECDESPPNDSPYSSPPSIKIVKNRIVKALGRPSAGSRIPFGVVIKETIVESELNALGGKRKRLQEGEEVEEESWNVGRMLREKCGVDPSLCELSDQRLQLSSQTC